VRESLTLNRSAGDGPGWVSEGSIVPRKPGNAGGGKWPWFWVLRTCDVTRSPGGGTGRSATDTSTRSLASYGCRTAGGCRACMP